MTAYLTCCFAEETAGSSSEPGLAVNHLTPVKVASLQAQNEHLGAGQVGGDTHYTGADDLLISTHLFILYFTSSCKGKKYIGIQVIILTTKCEKAFSKGVVPIGFLWGISSPAVGCLDDCEGES